LQLKLLTTEINIKALYSVISALTKIKYYNQEPAEEVILSFFWRLPVEVETSRTRGI